MDLVTYIMPDWTICPLFNSDESGISDDDAETLNAFLAREKLGIPVKAEPVGFRFNNDIDSLAVDCHAVSFPAPKVDQ